MNNKLFIMNKSQINSKKIKKVFHYKDNMKLHKN